MRAAALAAAGVLALSACTPGGAVAPAPSQTSPLIATRAPATPVEKPPTLGTFTFFAELRPADMVPPIAGDEAGCAGQGRLVLKAKLDGTRITAATAQILLFVTGCPPQTQITLAHIHKGAAGRTGDVAIATGQERPTAVAQGGIGINVEDIAVETALVPDIVRDPAGYYLEVHSVLHPAGLMRGQLGSEP